MPMDLSKYQQLEQGLEPTETHHFHILQRILCGSLHVSLCVDMRHITPVVSAIILVPCRRIGVVENEAVDARAIDDALQVIDLCLIRSVPGDTRGIGGSMLACSAGRDQAQYWKDVCTSEHHQGGQQIETDAECYEKQCPAESGGMAHLVKYQEPCC